MLELNIPGGATMQIGYLVMDYNGTIAEDGQLLPCVAEKIRELSALLEIIVVTADTFGCAAEQLRHLPVKLHILPAERQDEAKQQVVESLPADAVAVGNGRNDVLMLEAAALGIALVQAEGACVSAVQAADVLCLSVVDALTLLLKTKRLYATLRC